MHDQRAHQDLDGASVLVMGLGRFGGGLGVTRYLLEHGANVLLNDRASEKELAGPLAALGEHSGLRVVLGDHDPAHLEGMDMLVVNPAVPRPWIHPMVCEAAARGIPVSTEIEIAYRQLNPKSVIAITGSAGKSTTSAMAHHALRSLGIDAILAGNIGGSLLDRADKITESTVVVLELSSAMIYWLWGREGVKPPEPPRVACVTSYASNHLDWHDSEQHYLQSKQRLLQILTDQCAAVLPDELSSWKDLTTAQIRVVRDEDLIEDCAVPGKHNARNAACAQWCATAMCPQLSSTLVQDAIRSFPGLPHRLQRCFESDGVVYFNDSKSTTPKATHLAISALESLARRDRVHLIVGGYDKGADLSSLAQLAPELGGLYCIGATADRILQGVNHGAFGCGTLEQAMRSIHSRVQPGDIVLLSPACASWDQFSNYEARGDRFAELASQQQGTLT